MGFDLENIGPPLVVAILAKHGGDSLGKFSVVCLVDATGVHPEVLEAILSGLLSVEKNLFVARLVLASAVCRVFEGRLLDTCQSCVRKDRIGRVCVVANQVLSEAEFTSLIVS